MKSSFTFSSSRGAEGDEATEDEMLSDQRESPEGRSAEPSGRGQSQPPPPSSRLRFFYRLHQLDPAFFDGFGWYKETGSFLIAEPEKALVDCLYLSTRKRRQFGYFPELHFSKSFSFKKAKKWIKKISEYRIRICVERKLKKLSHSPRL